MNNQEYWRQRTERDMKQYIKRADDVADTLKAVYISSINDLDGKAKALFQKFRTRYGLSEYEARRLLNKMRNPSDIKSLLNALKQDPKNADLVREIEANTYSYRIMQLQAIEKEIMAITTAIAVEQESVFHEVLTEIASKSYFHNMYNLQQRVGVFWPFKTLSKDKVERILNKPWYGANYKTRIAKGSDYLARKLKEEVMVGMLTGRAYHQTSMALKDALQVDYYKASRLIRTESAHVANELHREAYEESGVEKYIYVATLDLRTSKTCRQLDGKVFKVLEAETGKNYPPMHPNCRSTTIAWMPKELMDKLTRTARDKDGKNIKVPMSMTYQEWYNKYIQGNKAKASIDGSSNVEKQAQISKDNYLGFVNTAMFSISPYNTSIDGALENLVTSEVGKEALEFINQGGATVEFVFGKLGARGSTIGNKCEIDIAVCKSNNEIAKTIIHEATHAKYDIGGCVWAEAVCFAQEKKHLVNRPLTFAEKRYIVKLAHQAYDEDGYKWKKGGRYGRIRF